MTDLEQLRQNILTPLNSFYQAWSQWPGNVITDSRAEGMRIAILTVEREFEKVMNNE
jgi:hypothetical protein